MRRSIASLSVIPLSVVLVSAAATRAAGQHADHTATGKVGRVHLQT